MAEELNHESKPSADSILHADSWTKERPTSQHSLPQVLGSDTATTSLRRTASSPAKAVLGISKITMTEKESLPESVEVAESGDSATSEDGAVSTPAGRSYFPRMFKKGVATKTLDVPFELWRMILVNMALLVAGFMVGMDQSIMGPAIPTIVAQFNSINDIGAYQSAYLLPQCVLHPMCNKLYSITSFSTAYIGSVLVFGAGGLVCATATTSAALICGRAVAGIGAVGLSIGGFRLLAMLPESKRQNLSLGFFSMILGCSIVVGPIVGGVITTAMNWHWIFWINLPVLGFVFLCVFVATFTGGPDLRGENSDLPFLKKMDILNWFGTCLFALALTPLILALQFSQQHGWGSALVIVMFVLSGVSFIALIAQQRRTTSKIFDPAVALNKSVWATCGLFFSALSAVGVLVLFLPFLLQLLKGVSPRTSGFESFPLAATITLATFIFSIVSTITPFFNPFAITGCALLVVACALFLTLPIRFSVPQLIGYELIAGFGVGMAWLSEIIFPRAALNKFQLAMSLGYSRMLQQIGATISVQVATIIFTSRLKSELSGFGQTAADLSALLGSGTASSKKPHAATPAVAEHRVLRAYQLAIRDGLIVAIVFAVLSLGFALVLPWPRLKGGITHVRREVEDEEEASGNVGRSSGEDSTAGVGNAI